MLFCGVDIGTTSTKAVLLDREGQVADEVTFPAPGDVTAMYWHEHFCQTLDFFAARGRLRDEEIACSVTGQGGSFVLTDGRYRPVSGASSWTALSDDGVVRDLVEVLGETGYYHLTGWPPHGWLAACKLKQMLRQKGLATAARNVATVPDFIYAQVTGKLSTDVTSAQIAGLVDFQRSQWSRDIIGWAGIRDEWLPPIVPDLRIVAEDVRTKWGRMTLVTGSHDQYAAMEAAGLEIDRSVMLGTGTAWVLNGRTSRPLFDDEQFLVHPGRDLHPDCYGFIVTLWQIGAGFDKLLASLGVTQTSLAQLEDTLADESVPQEPVTVDLAAGVVTPGGDACLAVRRYMEWAGAEVLRALENCGLVKGLEKIIVTGGAMKSRFWPQAIADICGLTVEAVDYPYFTAYGAALHAREALQRPAQARRFPDTAVVRTYAPRQAERYRAWYEECQKPQQQVHKE
jgi:sugar (pentulose or hexulose) kinase